MPPSDGNPDTTADDATILLNGLDRLRVLLDMPRAYAQETCSRAADEIEAARAAICRLTDRVNQLKVELALMENGRV